jgi:hypothetical protein
MKRKQIKLEARYQLPSSVQEGLLRIH